MITVRFSVVKLNQKLTHFPWAILETEGHSEGPQVHRISQARFESETAAQIAYRNHLLNRKGA